MNNCTADKVTKTSVLVDGNFGRKAVVRCGQFERQLCGTNPPLRRCQLSRTNGELEHNFRGRKGGRFECINPLLFGFGSVEGATFHLKRWGISADLGASRRIR